MVRNKKGSQRERELVILFDTNGFAVMRAPASGGATDRELPDVLAGNGNTFYAVEAKSSGGDPIYIKEQEVEELTYFAENFGAKPLLGARFDSEYGDPSYGNDDVAGWYFFDPKDVYRTDSGNYRIKKETALEDGIPFEELDADPFN